MLSQRLFVCFHGAGTELLCMLQDLGNRSRSQGPVIDRPVVRQPCGAQGAQRSRSGFRSSQCVEEGMLGTHADFMASDVRLLTARQSVDPALQPGCQTRCTLLQTRLPGVVLL